jgi:dipeptidyl aminopeptidase/acylaminoacyl peptidase
VNSNGTRLAESRTLTAAVAPTHAPEWSADGATLFVTGEGDSGQGLYRVDVESGLATLLAPGTIFPVHATPDGRSVLFIDRSVLPFTLRSLDLASGDRVDIAHGIVSFRLAPDAGRVSAFAADTRQTPVVLVDLATGARRELLRLPTDGDTELVGWTPDGTEVIVSRPGPRAPDGARGPRVLIGVPLNGGRPREIVRMPGALWPRDFDLTRDGQRIAFTQGYFTRSAWVMEGAAAGR